MASETNESYDIEGEGLSVFLFSREESRPHVHVACPDGEAKYWLEPEIELSRNHGLSRFRLKEIEEIIEVRYEDIKGAWQKRLG